VIDEAQSTSTARVTEKALFDRRMLEALVCPVSQTVLAYDVERQELVSKAAKLAFPIRGGIPIMLASEARALE
jgi:uncharacterized protein YbaR (Trm112 family)